MLETLEAYINKEFETEDVKARAEKPFVYTDFKAEDIATTYKYYYRITLLKEDIKRLRELNPRMIQIKKTDENPIKTMTKLFSTKSLEICFLNSIFEFLAMKTLIILHLLKRQLTPVQK